MNRFNLIGCLASDSPLSPAETNSLSQHASGEELPPTCTHALLHLCFLGLCGFEDLGLMSSSTKGQVCPCPLTPNTRLFFFFCVFTTVFCHIVLLP